MFTLPCIVWVVTLSQDVPGGGGGGGGREGAAPCVHKLEKNLFLITIHLEGAYTLGIESAPVLTIKSYHLREMYT